MLIHRILLVLAFVLSAVAARTASCADGFEEAQALYRQGLRDEALARIEAQLQRNPRDARSRFLQGVIFTEQGRDAQAIAQFTSLTQDFPEMPEPYNNLAVLYASQHNYQGAREALEMAIRAHPDYATAHENLGDVYAALARASYQTALELDKYNRSARGKLERLGGIEPGAASGEIPAPAAAAPGAPAAAAVPAGQPAAQASPMDVSAPIRAMVDSWAQAWSRGDASAYLSHYAPAFHPPGGEARSTWEAQRRKRLDQVRGVSVTVVSPQVTLENANRASVSFRQNYASPTFKRTTMKTLRLVRVDGRWLIEREIAPTN